MVNIKKVALINVTVFLILFAIYFSFESGSFYYPPVIPIYYPVGIILFAVVFFILNRILHQKKLFIIASIIVSCVLFVSLTGLSLHLTENILDGLYTNHRSILDLPTYLQERRRMQLAQNIIAQKGLKYTSLVEIEFATNKGISLFYTNDGEKGKHAYFLIDNNNNQLLDFVDMNAIVNNKIESLKLQGKISELQDTSYLREGMWIDYINTNKKLERYKWHPKIENNIITFTETCSEK